jgi:methionine sulfoxide reductase heme-binding subunit
MTTWVILRSAGVGAYLMLFFSVAWGLVGTSGALGRRVSKASAVSIHRFFSTCGLLLLAIHVGGLMVDPFMPFGPPALLIPGAASYRPAATAFGVIAMYAAVVVLVTSWIRKRIGTTWWRRLHLLAVPAFGLSLAHGIFAGTDSTRPWMWWMYLVTGGLVVFLVVLRGLAAAYRPERTARPAAERAAPHTAVDEPRPSRVPTTVGADTS